MSQVIQHLPSQWENLSSKLMVLQKKKKKSSDVAAVSLTPSQWFDAPDWDQFQRTCTFCTILW
jgi:hypothetical protein